MMTIAGILGFLIPPLMQVINRQNWSSEVRAVTAFAACAVGAVVATWWQGDLDNFDDIRTSILVTFGAAIFFYNQYWKASGLADRIMEKTG